jgi:hypothetical protein
MKVAFDETAKIEHNKDTEIQVYFDGLNQSIHVDGIESDYIFQLYDAAGRLVLTDNNSPVIHVNLVAGVYFWRIDLSGIQFTEKLFIHE